RTSLTYFASTLNDQSGSRRRFFFLTHNFLFSAIGATQPGGLPVERRGLIHRLNAALRYVGGRFRRSGARSLMRRLIQRRRVISVRSPTRDLIRSLVHGPTRVAPPGPIPRSLPPTSQPQPRRP